MMRNNQRVILFLMVLVIFITAIRPSLAVQKTPQYEVFLELSNHNIEKGREQTDLEANIIGIGKCDSGLLTINSEIPLVYQSTREDFLLNAHSLYESDFKESGINFRRYCVGQKCRDDFFESSMPAFNLDVDLNNSLFTTEENRIRLKLDANCASCSDYGGEYEINALFICNKGNESFIFKDSSQFRIMLNNEDTQFTTAILAIVISVFAILLTFAKDFLIPAIFKPRISLEAENDEECIEDEKYCRWLRLRIRNSDCFFSRGAKGCYVKLLSIKNLSKGTKINPFNSFPLPWVLYDTYKEDLAIGEHHLVDLAVEYENQRVLILNSKKFKLPRELDYAIKRGDEFGHGVYSFKIAVYGDNFKSVVKIIKVELTQTFGELKYVK